jgi:hypothetical protein
MLARRKTGIYKGTEGRTQFLLVSPGQGETDGLNHGTNRKTGSESVVLKITAKKHRGVLAQHRYVPPKRRVQLNALHGVISQKMILFTYLYVLIFCFLPHTFIIPNI